MKNVFVMPVFFFILTNAIGANFDCSNYKDIENDCFVLVRKNSFSSLFPVKSPSEIYEWNVSSVNPEYLWETEVGACKNKEFTSFGYAYSFFLLNVPGEKNRDSGSLEKLIGDKNIAGGFYERPKRGGFQGIFDDIFPELSISATIGPEGSLVVYSTDTRAQEIIFSKKPTHAKLTMRAPASKHSYTCIGEIIYQ